MVMDKSEIFFFGILYDSSFLFVWRTKTEFILSLFSSLLFSFSSSFSSSPLCFSVLERVQFQLERLSSGCFKNIQHHLYSTLSTTPLRLLQQPPLLSLVLFISSLSSGRSVTVCPQERKVGVGHTI